MISYLLVVQQHRTQIVIHALLKCQQENLYHEQNVTHILSCNEPTSPAYYTLSLHDALPISRSTRTIGAIRVASRVRPTPRRPRPRPRSEEHTSELQSRRDLVCRLLLEKKKT